MTKQQNGNVFLYILIAVGLFAGLAFVISRAQQSNETAALTDAQIKTRAEAMIAYANQAAQTWAQMSSTGTDLDELNLDTPADGTFNTGAVQHKLFHVSGGGLLYNAMNTPEYRADATTPVGWHAVKVDAQWTASSGSEFFLTYLNVNPKICTEINRKLIGSTTVSNVSTNLTTTFVDGTSPLDEADCAACKTYPSVCIRNGSVYAFYNMLAAR